jgi:hypothetical protein
VQVNLQGLNLPTSVTWTASNVILIAEKAGVVKSTTNWVDTPTNIVLDISARVSSFG